MMVITGLGVFAPTGVGLDDYWATTLAGKSGIDRIRRFDPTGYTTQLAGQVHDFEAGDHVPSKLLAQTDRMTHFAFAGAEMALADAGVDLDAFPEYERAVVTANSSVSPRARPPPPTRRSRSTTTKSTSWARWRCCTASAGPWN